MGRWLEALKKHENAPDTNRQNRQNSASMGFEGFEGANSTDFQENLVTKKIIVADADRADKTDNTSQMVVSSVLSDHPGSENENFSSDQRHALEGEKGKGPLLFSHPTQKSERRRIIPFPGREWTPDSKIRSDDPERYLDALRLHGPMSYGMAMRVLQWGGTRAGQAEDALLEQGRIKFNERGWAYPVDSSEDSNV
ncbi:hypothetical protein M8994_18530 [Brucella sp. 21LCYQ03]|nr:hypothetical protein [Brucella sp. 21LCYQ03]